MVTVLATWHLTEQAIHSPINARAKQLGHTNVPHTRMRTYQAPHVLGEVDCWAETTQHLVGRVIWGEAEPWADLRQYLLNRTSYGGVGVSSTPRFIHVPCRTLDKIPEKSIYTRTCCKRKDFVRADLAQVLESVIFGLSAFSEWDHVAVPCISLQVFDRDEYCNSPYFGSRSDSM